MKLIRVNTHSGIKWIDWFVIYYCFVRPWNFGDIAMTLTYPDEMADLMKDMKTLVEQTYTLNNSSRVILMGHSMGCPVLLYFLNQQSQAWKDKYVKSLITLAGPWGGAVKTMRLMASGGWVGWSLVVISSSYLKKLISRFSHILTYMPPPCSNGPTFVFICHTLRFCAMSFVISQSFMSSLMLSSHLFLGLPLLPFPCTCMFNIFLVVSSPSFLNTWPYHRSRFFLRNVVIGSTLASLQMSSFLKWSSLVLPLAHLSILISVACSFLCIVFRHCPALRPVFHCWLDYGFVILSLSLIGTFLSHMTPDTSLHLAHTAFTLLFTSVSETPSAANILPRYLNTYTVGIGLSPSFMVSSWCGVGILWTVFVLLMQSPYLSNWSFSSCSTVCLDVSQSTRSSVNSIDSGGDGCTSKFPCQN